MGFKLEILVWVILHPQNLSSDDQKSLKDKMVETLVDNVDDDPSIKVTSLHVQFLGQRARGDQTLCSFYV